MVLDLDETLVCAYETSSLSASVRDQATEAGLKWFELECVSVDKVGVCWVHKTFTSINIMPVPDEFSFTFMGLNKLSDNIFL